MRRAGTLLITLLCLAAYPAHADQATAKEVARINNCPPKKIEVYDQSLGTEGKTVYRVECNLPKMVGENAGDGANSLLIACKDSLCELLRPLSNEGKK